MGRGGMPEGLEGGARVTTEGGPVPPCGQNKGRGEFRGGFRIPGGGLPGDDVNTRWFVVLKDSGNRVGEMMSFLISPLIFSLFEE